MPRVRGRGRGRGPGARGRGGRDDPFATIIASLPPDLQAQVASAIQQQQQDQAAGGQHAAQLPQEPAAQLPPSAESAAGGEHAAIPAKQEHEEHTEHPEVASRGSLPASEASTSTAFSFAQEVQRQANRSTLPSQPSTPSTPLSSAPPSEVYNVDLSEFVESGDVDPTMCPICLVVPKQSDKKRFCMNHQRCFESIERSAMKGVDKKSNPMIDTEESKSFKLIFGWRGHPPFKGQGDRKKANKIVSLFAGTLVRASLALGIGCLRLSLSHCPADCGRIE